MILSPVLRRLPGLFVLCLLPVVLHAQGFEGTVTNEMSIPMLGDQKIPVLINMKGDKTMTAMDVPMQGSIKLFSDKILKKMTIVMEGQKTGMEMDMNAIEEAMKNKKFSAPALTGKKETIKGYKSEEYAAPMDGGAELDLWMTKEMPKDIASAVGTSSQASLQANGLNNGSFQELYKQGFVPVRMVVKKDGDAQVIIEYAKAEAKKLDDKIFMIPADIKVQKFDPATMMPHQDSDQDAKPESADSVKTPKADPTK